MEFKGTKGKWFACCLKTTPHFIFDETGETVICKPIHNQEMRDSMPTDEYKANALLISKAPELLEIITEIKDYFETPTEEHPDDEYLKTHYFHKLKNLIKEATEL